MIYNPYKRLLGILPQRPLLIGVVLSIVDGTATVELPGGAQVKARGDASIGMTVFLKDGMIEGEAPDLPISVIEVGA